MVTGTDPTRPRTIEGIIRPDPSDHYGQILAWIVCWPWNLMWTFCIHNPFRYICEFVLHEIQSTLDEIATGEFSQIERDLDERPAPAQTTSAPLSEPITPLASPKSARPHRVEMDSVPLSAVEVTSASAIETVDEAAFLACEPESEDASAVETLAETPAWENLLKTESSEPAAATSQDKPEPIEPYTPPTLPPTPQQDPWYYAPRGRNQTGSSLKDKRPYDSPSDAN